MKNLLSMGAVAVLGSSIAVPNAVPNITLNNMIINKYNNNINNNINLPIAQIVQEEDTYCVPANIQMIFTFFGINLDPFSQGEIYQALDGDAHGIILDDHVANYLNNHIPSAHYGANHLAANFGGNIQEQWAFQNYVYTSLSHGHPIIFGYNIPGHAILISGIEPDYSDPELTRYIYIDPSEPNSERTHFTGNALPIILREGGDILGEGVNPDFEQQEISVGINNREVGADWLNDYQDHEVARIRTDITAITGATSTGDFAKKVDNILLPVFNGEIYLFTWKKHVDKLSIHTDFVPPNDDNWSSARVTIADVNEDVGSAHIEGRILAQIQFERTQSLDHLLMYLIIYVGGISWATPNWAHVWFRTGDILEFSKR